MKSWLLAILTVLVLSAFVRAGGGMPTGYALSAVYPYGYFDGTREVIPPTHINWLDLANNERVTLKVSDPPILFLPFTPSD